MNQHTNLMENLVTNHGIINFKKEVDMYFTEITEYLRSMKLTVIEIQGNDPTVGIPDGYVLFEQDEELLEMKYNDCLHHTLEKSEYNVFIHDALPELLNM